MNRRSIAVAGLATSCLAPAADAYPIDCAIILCLAGGFPPSAECTAVKMEMIRRITPFPIEPPVQVWLCPMSGAPISIAAPTTGADIDISDPAFDPIRSVEVYHISWWHMYWENSAGEGNCRLLRSTVQSGSYGPQGEWHYRWHADPGALPDWMRPTLHERDGCEWIGSERAVGMTYLDAETGEMRHEVYPY